MKAKKVLGVLLVAAMTSISLLGCGKGENGETSAAASSVSSDADSTKGADKGEKVNLMLWMPPFGTGDIRAVGGREQCETFD
jgi:multiple sugar transport system substrate-binding protein